jgi:predicted ATP-dependent endonuclease of OLD family
MLIKVDDYISKVFFAKKVLIIEGDTEEVVLKETIERIDEEKRLYIMHNWQIVKARGKASIISLVKYLKSLGVNPYVMYDLDAGNEHAEKFNKPILDIVGDSSMVFQLKNCIEDILGYKAPTNEKPFKAYKYIKDNWHNVESISTEWKNVFCEIFGFDNIEKT